MLEVGGWGLEVGGWGLEVGGWRLEVGGWRLEVGLKVVGRWTEETPATSPYMASAHLAKPQRVTRELTHTTTNP